MELSAVDMDDMDDMDDIDDMDDMLKAWFLHVPFTELQSYMIRSETFNGFFDLEVMLLKALPTRNDKKHDIRQVGRSESASVAVFLFSGNSKSKVVPELLAIPRMVVPTSIRYLHGSFILIMQRTKENNVLILSKLSCLE